MFKAYDWIARGRPRENGRAGRALATSVAVGLAALLMAMAFGVYVDRWIALHLFVAGMLTLAFLTVTGNPRRPTGNTVASSILIAASWVVCVYFLAMHDVHAKRIPMIDELSFADMTAAIVLTGLVLEATRRCIGMTLVVLVLGFLAYGIWGDALPGAFSHRPLSAQEIVDHLVYSTNGLMGPALEVAAFRCSCSSCSARCSTAGAAATSSTISRTASSAGRSAARPRSPCSRRGSTARSRGRPPPTSSRPAPSRCR